MPADDPDHLADGPPGEGGPSGGRPRTERLSRTARDAARTTGRGLRGVARGASTASRFTARQARRASTAEGAGDSGLSRLIELHAVNAAGDAAIAISLAGTLFFQVPSGEARDKVALFLALTLLPFTIVAPLIGPFLDRFSHGRRWAIGATLAARAFLAWSLAGSVSSDSPWLFPAALGCLVASRAYGVTRATALPRLLPPSLTLVKANARTSLAGVIGAGISAPIAALASLAGPEWSLRYAFVLFVLATVWAIRLPQRVDSSAGEGTMTLLSPGEQPTGTDTGRSRLRMRIPGTVAFALRANLGPRWLSGFLTMFMAFLLRDNPIGDWRPEVLLALVIGAAGLGNILGIGLGSVLTRVNPAVTVALALLADTVMAGVTAVFYNVVTVTLLGLTAGLAQALAKLSLDATIQSDVPERVRTSAFARSDTTLQLAWVFGGFVGIALPLLPRLGLGAATVVLGTWAAFVLLTRPRRATARPEPTVRRD